MAKLSHQASNYTSNTILDQIFNIYSTLNRHHIPPSEAVINTIVNSCRTFGQPKRGTKLGKDFATFDIKLSEKGFCSFIAVCHSAGDVFNAMLVSNRWTSMNQEYPTGSAIQMIQLFFKTSFEEGLNNALKFYHQLPATPKPQVLNCILSECCKAGQLGFISARNYLAKFCDLGKFEAANRLVHDFILQPTPIGFGFLCRSSSEVGDAYVADILFSFLATEGAILGMKCNVIDCSQLIKAFSGALEINKALGVLDYMDLQKIHPNPQLYISLLVACGRAVSAEKALLVHTHITNHNFSPSGDIILGNALLSMYGKCAMIEVARSIFELLQDSETADAFSWGTIIATYAQHGMADKAFLMFEQMKKSNIQPDKVAYAGVLSACSHTGNIDKLWDYFRELKASGIEIDIGHYNSVVDVLSRKGLLSEAENFVCKEIIKPDYVTYITLLGACWKWKDLNRGEIIAKKAIELFPHEAATYVLLSNIYAKHKRFDKVQEVREQMKRNQINKTPGLSWTEINGKTFKFSVSDRSHAFSDDILKYSEKLHGEIKKIGYVPDTGCVLLDIPQEEKERHLCEHSERMAIVYGLICTPKYTPLLIANNLRMCEDCHVSIEFISKLVERVIKVRDASRFHIFQKGKCSCGGYW